MKTGVYSSYDFVAEVYSQPWLAPNDKCAIRAFEYATNDPQFVIHKSPEDYALFKLAEFDDHTGLLTPVNPCIVAKAIDLYMPNQGAAVGGESPLKQQSENNGVLEMDASEKVTACEVSDTPFSKAKKIICDEKGFSKIAKDFDPTSVLTPKDEE